MMIIQTKRYSTLCCHHVSTIPNSLSDEIVLFDEATAITTSGMSLGGSRRAVKSVQSQKVTVVVSNTMRSEYLYYIGIMLAYRKRVTFNTILPAVTEFTGWCQIDINHM